MKYILKYYLYSKYHEYRRREFKEFMSKEAILTFINDMRLEKNEYEIFIKVI